jgi:hypothetical protein
LFLEDFFEPRKPNQNDSRPADGEATAGRQDTGRGNFHSLLPRVRTTQEYESARQPANLE